MKTKLIYFIMFLTLFSCSSDDNNKPTIDVSLLYGQWFRVNLCNSQNNLVFNSDGTYIHTYSGNTCDNNDNDTYQETGTFIINGNEITFNEINREVVEFGDVTSVPTTTFDLLVYEKITILNENELFIERKFSDGQDFYNNWSFTKQ